MSSIDHLHTEAEMLKVREHSELLSAHYLARCLKPGNVCHSITTRATPERQMTEPLYTRHRNTVEPKMVKMIGKLHSKHSTLMQSIRNVVLDARPPPISSPEKNLTRKERSTQPSLNYDPDNVDSWAPIRAESRRMQASTSVQTAARRHIMSIISSFARLTRLQ